MLRFYYKEIRRPLETLIRIGGFHSLILTGMVASAEVECFAGRSGAAPEAPILP